MVATAAVVAGMRWRRWTCAVAAVVDMPSVVAATRALPAAVRASHQRQTGDIPFVCCVKVAHHKLADQSIYGRPHSREQCRRPNDAAQCNRERNAQCKREPKPQI